LKEWKMSTEISSVLEEKITSALANARIASMELRELIPETEAALAAAEAPAQAEREKALDPVASPDSAKAERSVWAAEFRRDRLRSSLTHLRQRLGEVEASERQRDWEEDYKAVGAKVDARAKELAEFYQSVTAQLCDLFREAKAIDQECARVNAAAQAGEKRRLLGVELTARKLASHQLLT
jgi:FtsZ-binding cell division protein ZapB